MGLPQQLASFSVADVACFCCSNNHIMPGTRLPLSCDRQLVLQTIRTWFADGMSKRRGIRRDGREDEDEEEEVMRNFEEMVREHFGAWVLRTVGPARLPYKWSVLIMSPY